MLRDCCGTLVTGRRAPLGRAFNDSAVLELPFPWLSLFDKRAVLLPSQGLSLRVLAAGADCCSCLRAGRFSLERSHDGLQKHSTRPAWWHDEWLQHQGRRLSISRKHYAGKVERYRRHWTMGRGQMSDTNDYSPPVGLGTGFSQRIKRLVTFHSPRPMHPVTSLSTPIPHQYGGAVIQCNATGCTQPHGWVREMVTPRDKEIQQPIRGEVRSHLAHVKIALSETGVGVDVGSADPPLHVHIIRTPRQPDYPKDFSVVVGTTVALSDFALCPCRLTWSATHSAASSRYNANGSPCLFLIAIAARAHILSPSLSLSFAYGLFSDLAVIVLRTHAFRLPLLRVQASPRHTQHRSHRDS
ncbi:hypothetical protein KC349_g302 [Hortaea werneckii]|nr:hypothetical protein KC349_g302 [Hortaea werneckii]